MELRDQFASHAMAALIASPKVNNAAGAMTDHEYATLAYVMADAMLKAREMPVLIPQPQEQKSEKADA